MHKENNGSPAAPIVQAGFALGGLLALGAVLSAYIVSSTVKDVKLAGQTIEVMGYAEKTIVSDLASWRIGITARNTDRMAAYAKVEKDTETFLGYLKSNGIAEGYLLPPVSVVTYYKTGENGYQTSEVESYGVTRYVEIESRDVKLMTKVAGHYDDLIKQGLEFEYAAPQYFYSGLSDLKTSMIAAATQNAKERARQFAEGSGAEVGAMRSARQGVFQVTAPNSNEISDYGVSDTSSITKNIKAVVAIQYAIEN